MRARSVLKACIPAVIEAVDRGALAVSTAAKLAERSPEEQARLLALNRSDLARELKPSQPSQSSQPAPAAVELPDANIPSGQHCPIIEQRIADEWLMQNIRTGGAKLTQSKQGFCLEFDANCLDELRTAMHDEKLFLRLLERGVWMVKRHGARAS